MSQTLSPFDVILSILTGDGSLLYRQTLDTFNSALAQGTYANRMTQAAAYIKFALTYNVDYLNPSVLNVCMYCQHLANIHPATSSLKNYLAGAKTWVLEHMGNISSFLSVEVSLTIKSILKKSSNVTKRAAPLSLNDITQICMYLDSAKNTPPAIKPCVLIGFACFLRASNLVSTTNAGWAGPHTLLVRNLFVAPKGLIVVIPTTKTRTKPYAIKIPYDINHHLCPVRAWVRYKSIIAPAVGGPAFVLEDRSPVTSKLVLAFIKAALATDPARDVSRITMHSLRRGAVQNAQDQGLTHKEIMDLGAWSSTSGLKPYLRA